MKAARLYMPALLGTVLLVAANAAVTLPLEDQRAKSSRSRNSPRTFPPVQSQAEWQNHARAIREQILVSCGMWPLPERPPVRAEFVGKSTQTDYTVEKVFLQTFPGFYLAGNLYRPRGQGPGPFPAILNPHGHWRHGRLHDSAEASIPARCITFARQGMIAFAYDMVGYTDTVQLGEHGRIFTDRTNLLWNISLMGLQTWNSLRALDFLESLPDSDDTRLACTGASGGGTQTFILGAIDDRLAAQAPVVMVSHSMQGGCLCENAPGLRVDYSNMEIAAAAAPRPQLLVGARGDWTRTTMELEGPAIAAIYQLFNAPEKFRYVRFDSDHNYNQTSREEVYGWFGKWLRRLPEAKPIPEPAYSKLTERELRVFPDGPPTGAVTERELASHWVGLAKAQWERLKPTNPVLLERYRREMLPAWRHTLQVAFIEHGLLVEAGPIRKFATYTSSELILGRLSKGDRVPVRLLTPRRDTLRTLTVLVHPGGIGAYLREPGEPEGLAGRLLASGQAVLLLDLFRAGGRSGEGQRPGYFDDYFTTYNRTETQERVQDIITACAFAQTHNKGRRVILCGSGRAGLWCMLAAPAADALIADAGNFDARNDQAWLAPDLFVPGLKRMGGFEGALVLNTPRPLLIHHTGERFDFPYLQEVYSRLRSEAYLRVEKGKLGEEAIVDWIMRLEPH